MSPDVTIADVWSTLVKPDKYVTGVLSHLHDCTKEHGNAAFRLGTDGKGKYPSYRVCYTVDGLEHVFGSYIDSGTAFPVGFDRVTPGRWSTKAMTRDELLAFSAKQNAAQ